MPGTMQSVRPRTIVVPRQLQSYFYERLTVRYAARDDVEIVVDRRVGERRRARWVTGPGPLTDRRRSERRAGLPTWSLPDMPCAIS